MEAEVAEEVALEETRGLVGDAPATEVRVNREAAQFGDLVLSVPARSPSTSIT
jgi:hypothetical protein